MRLCYVERLADEGLSQWVFAGFTNIVSIWMSSPKLWTVGEVSRVVTLEAAREDYGVKVP